MQWIVITKASTETTHLNLVLKTENKAEIHLKVIIHFHFTKYGSPEPVLIRNQAKKYK